MYAAKVVGNVVATQKDEGLLGSKLLVICPLYQEFNKENCKIAVDCVGAGNGERVLVTKGSSVRKTGAFKDSPVDLAIVGIIDQIEIDEDTY